MCVSDGVTCWQVVEKCFSRDVQFLITNRQSSAALQRSVKAVVQSPSSVASPSPASPGLFKVSQVNGVFDSSPAVPSVTDNTGTLVSQALLSTIKHR